MIPLYTEVGDDFIMVPEAFLIIEPYGSFKAYTHIKIEKNFQYKTFVQVITFNNEESYGTINYLTMINLKYIAMTYEQFLNMKVFV